MEISAQANQRRIQVIPAQSDNQPTYVFLVFPWIHEWSEQQNRARRREFREACVWVAKLKFERATDIVGLATETGIDHSRRSEDAVYLDAREWSGTDEERARSYQCDLGIMVSDRLVGKHVSEYPDGRSDNHDPRVIPKNPRNNPARVEAARSSSIVTHDALTSGRRLESGDGAARPAIDWRSDRGD